MLHLLHLLHVLHWQNSVSKNFIHTLQQHWFQPVTETPDNGSLQLPQPCPAFWIDFCISIHTLSTIPMKAEMIHQYGGPEELKLEDAPMPQLNPDDVLIKVIATSVNPVDYKVREGHDKWGHRDFPAILGWDVSGVIEQVGRDVKDYHIG